MNLQKYAVAALVATSLIAVPVSVQAEQARGAAVNKSLATSKKASHLGEDSTTYLYAGAAVAAVGVGVWLLTKKKSTKSP